MNINLHPFPILTTNRLILRELRNEDSDELMQLRSNELVNAYLDRDKPHFVDDIIAFINKIHTIVQNQEGIYWVIALPSSGKLIGTICYWNFDLENGAAEIGYELSPEYHRQGIMQEAIEKVTEYGLNVMQLKEIMAFCRSDNESSIKLLKRNGFDWNKSAEDNYAEYVLKHI